jgi:hypothetical protein
VFSKVIDEPVVAETLVNESVETVVIRDCFSITTVIKLVQPWNALEPILVTELGIVTDVKAEQFMNILTPIIVTKLPIVTVIKLVQPPNA